MRGLMARTKRVAGFSATVTIGFILAAFVTLPSPSHAATAPCPFVLSPSPILLSTGDPIVMSPCPGQEWAKSYGTASSSEYGRVIRQTSDGGYILAIAAFGGTGSTVLLKLSAAGSILWQKTFGPSYAVTSDSLEALPDGGFVFVSHNDQGDARLVRLDGTGSILWEKLYGGAGGDNLVAVSATTDGGFILGGATDSWGAGSLDFWILKLDALGAVQWERVAGTPAYEFLRSIAQTADGGYVAVGERDMDGWALKLDGQGNVVSSTRMAGTKSYNGKFWTVVATPDGGFAAGASGSVLVRFTASGSVAWKKSYGAYVIQGLAPASDGGFVATGAVKISVYNQDAFVLRLDGSGNAIWMKTYGGLEPKFSWGGEEGWDVQQTTDGGFIVAGETLAFSLGHGDAWVLKLDPNGNVASSCPSGIGASRSVSASNARNAMSDLAIATGPTAVAVGTWSSTVADYTALTLTQCSA